MKDARLPQGVTHERCWCGHLAKVKESIDFSTCMGMKFFMCPNYDASLPRQASSSYERPPSPPPLCKWYHWIDTEQPAWAVQEIADRSRRARESFLDEERAERKAANAKKERKREMKEFRAEQARNRELNRKRREEEEWQEQVRKEAREAEMKRLRERAVEARAAEERGDKTGKYPRWTQGR
uniref:Uncharacterized protein n=1 Tax=Avena sativa TaxID=4498 RepID=A0ACD5Y511_AVESA